MLRWFSNYTVSVIFNADYEYIIETYLKNVVLLENGNSSKVYALHLKNTIENSSSCEGALYQR